MARKTLALALGGGAARGWAHIGVLRALHDVGLEPDFVVGTSIGAIVGAHYVAGRLESLENFVLSLTRRKFLSYLDFSISGSGLITGQRLFDRFDSHLEGLRFEDLETRFAAVATELATGHEVWLRHGSLVDAVRASSAIPGIVRPVKVNGRWLVDGALVNPIPVSVCRAMGAQVVVAVNLNGDGFGKGGTLLQDERAVERQPSVEKPQRTEWSSRAALGLLHRQVFGEPEDAAPSLSSVVFDAFSIVQDRMARSRLMGDPPDLMIAPDLAGIGAFDVHRGGELMVRGEAAAREQVPAIARRVNVVVKDIDLTSKLAATGT